MTIELTPQEVKGLIHQLENHEQQLGYDGAQWDTIQFVRDMIKTLKECYDSQC